MKHTNKCLNVMKFEIKQRNALNYMIWICIERHEWNVRILNGFECVNVLVIVTLNKVYC